LPSTRAHPNPDSKHYKPKEKHGEREEKATSSPARRKRPPNHSKTPRPDDRRPQPKLNPKPSILGGIDRVLDEKRKIEGPLFLFIDPNHRFWLVLTGFHGTDRHGRVRFEVRKEYESLRTTDRLTPPVSGRERRRGAATGSWAELGRDAGLG
jgi:hypothetical protein